MPRPVLPPADHLSAVRRAACTLDVLLADRTSSPSWSRRSRNPGAPPHPSAQHDGAALPVTHASPTPCRPASLASRPSSTPDHLTTSACLHCHYRLLPPYYPARYPAQLVRSPTALINPTSLSQLSSRRVRALAPHAHRRLPSVTTRPCHRDTTPPHRPSHPDRQLHRRLERRPHESSWPPASSLPHHLQIGASSCQPHTQPLPHALVPAAITNTARHHHPPATHIPSIIPPLTDSTHLTNRPCASPLPHLPGWERAGFQRRVRAGLASQEVHSGRYPC